MDYGTHFRAPRELDIDWPLHLERGRMWNVQYPLSGASLKIEAEHKCNLLDQIVLWVKKIKWSY